MIKIGTDKIAHATIGTGIFLVLLFIFNVYVAVIGAVLVGLGKEIYDRAIKLKPFSFWDFVATIIIPLIISAIKVYYELW